MARPCVSMIGAICGVGIMLGRIVPISVSSNLVDNLT
jgi:hypothetical protein